MGHTKIYTTDLDSPCQELSVHGLRFFVVGEQFNCSCFSKEDVQREQTEIFKENFQYSVDREMVKSVKQLLSGKLESESLRILILRWQPP